MFGELVIEEESKGSCNSLGRLLSLHDLMQKPNDALFVLRQDIRPDIIRLLNDPGLFALFLHGHQNPTHHQRFLITDHDQVSGIGLLHLFQIRHFVVQQPHHSLCLLPRFQLYLQALAFQHPVDGTLHHSCQGVRVTKRLGAFFND